MALAVDRNANSRATVGLKLTVSRVETYTNSSRVHYVNEAALIGYGPARCARKSSDAGQYRAEIKATVGAGFHVWLLHGGGDLRRMELVFAAVQRGWRIGAALEDMLLLLAPWSGCRLFAGAVRRPGYTRGTARASASRHTGSGPCIGAADSGGGASTLQREAG